jgi:hypothetical protein
LAVLVIALYFAFAAGEMFYSQHPVMMARFGINAEFAKLT